MVSSQQKDRIFEFYLQGEDECQHLAGKATPIDVIAQEEVLGGLERPACVVINDLDKIIELAMYIPDNGHRILNFDHIGLLF